MFALAHLTWDGNYNFVSPYSHEITHGVLLSLGSLVCLAAHARTRQPL